MNTRKREIVEVLSYDRSLDEMGLPRQKKPSRRNAEMIIYDYRQTMLSKDDIRFKDATYIGLTKDPDINDTNQIYLDGKVFDVLFVVTSRRYNQVFMKLTNVN